MASKKTSKSNARKAKIPEKGSRGAKKTIPARKASSRVVASKTESSSKKSKLKQSTRKDTSSKAPKKTSVGKTSAKKPLVKKATAKKVSSRVSATSAVKSVKKTALPPRASAAKTKKLPTKVSAAKSPRPPAARSSKKAVAAKVAVTKKSPTPAEKARLKKQLEAERVRQKKQQEREKLLAKKESERLKKESEREKQQLRKDKEKERRETERLKKESEREKEQLRKDREKAKVDLQKEKERLNKEKEKERLKKEKERELERLRKEKERERLKKEKERELERLRKEKERERERLRKEKEEERIAKEKERETYRRAREAERERVRSEKDAARRALEGRVAQQARRAQRIAGTGRGGSSRVYRPDAIPSQAGTRREGNFSERNTNATPARSMVRPSTPAPAPRPVPPAALDERWTMIQKRLKKRPERFQNEYAESFDMSWIHHDSALEGVVYTYQELKTAVDPNIVYVPDSSLQPVCEEIRRHKKAIDWTRELGTNDVPLSAEVLKRLLLLLHPEEGDLKSVKYRKEIPQHRLYFHDYAPPDKIAVRIRQAFDWLHGPEPSKLKDPVRVAARLHYDLLRTFPFPQDSGKVARLCMNILLLRAGLPPVIVHSTERQRYYDALRGSLPTIVQMINDSMRNAMVSIEKVLDEEESENSN